MSNVILAVDDSPSMRQMVGQTLRAAGYEVIEAAESITGKKVKLALVLHPNPDKFNGTATFQARGIKVVTSAQVLAKIPEVHEDRSRSFEERYRPDYPTELPKPEGFGDADTELSAGGVAVKVRVLGPGCSAAHVVAEYDGHMTPVPGPARQAPTPVQRCTSVPKSAITGSVTRDARSEASRGAGATRTPGLSRLSGSKMCLTEPISAMAWGEYIRPSSSLRARPSPCSPDIDPP